MIADVFESMCRKLGISPKTHIIVYDRSYANAWSARAWVMFRVGVNKGIISFSSEAVFYHLEVEGIDKIYANK